MKKTTPILIITGLIISSIAMMFLFGPSKKNTGPAPEYYLSSIDLFEAYVKNKEKSDSLYFNKVIQVTGTITYSVTKNKYHSVTLEGIDSTGGVVCNFSKKPEEKFPENGTEITIKGICDGYETNVVLSQCTISE